ncbi:MAG: ribosome maturation factor RimM [Lachnospiraceae bacterium]|nr:ribosome maturation factor RimM [Lachnospiraceae bacterium]
MEDYLRVGVIANTHGVRGEVKVFPTTDDPARFKKLKQAFIDMGKTKKEVEIKKVSFFKNMVILGFKDIDDINLVLPYKGHDLLVTRENAVPLEEGEFFICDILESTCYLEDGTEYGILTDVLQTAANDVYVIRKKKDGKEILIPGIPDCILDVDVENKKLTVNILKGLED